MADLTVSNLQKTFNLGQNRIYDWKLFTIEIDLRFTNEKKRS